MEKAIKQIEKLKKGITDNPAVMDILRKANESKDNEVKQESRKYFDTKLGSIQDTVIKMYEDRLNEKKAEFLRLTFANNQTVKKVDRWLYNNLSHANPGYMSMIPDEHGKSIEWEDMDDADGLMKKLKKAGFSFKVDMRESVRDELNEAQKWDLKDIQNTIKNSPKVKPYPKHTWHRRKLYAWDDYDLKRMKNHHNNPHSILKWDLKKISPNTDKGVDQLQQIEKAIYGLSQGLKTGKLSKQTMTDLSKEGVPLLSDIAKSLV